MANTISLGSRSITIVPDGSTDFNLATMQTTKFPLGSVVGDFTAGEIVVQAVSDAMGVVSRWDKRQKLLYLDSMTGTFDITNTITGASSGATGIPSETAYAFINGIRLSDIKFTPSSAGDRLIIRGKGSATGPERVNLFAVDAKTLTGSIGGHSLKENLYIKADEQVFGNAANAMIVLEFD